jgi:hypothetical protein
VFGAAYHVSFKTCVRMNKKDEEGLIWPSGREIHETTTAFSDGGKWVVAFVVFIGS